MCKGEQEKQHCGSQWGELRPCSGCSGHTLSRGAALLTPAGVFPHLNLIWEELLMQPGLSAGR